MGPRLSYWEVTAVTTLEVRSWSFGRVAGIADLYDPRVFGPAQDVRCACGKYVGADAVDYICDECGVRVSADSRSLRKRRHGHIDLACPCPHPLHPTVRLEAFPIAPIGFRQDADGNVTEIGCKYEALVRTNNDLARELPRKDAQGNGYYEAIAKPGTTAPLVQAMRYITGVAPDDSSLAETGLMAMFIKALATGDSCACSILRSCGLDLELSLTL